MNSAWVLQHHNNYRHWEACTICRGSQRENKGDSGGSTMETHMLVLPAFLSQPMFTYFARCPVGIDRTFSLVLGQACAIYDKECIWSLSLLMLELIPYSIEISLPVKCNSYWEHSESNSLSNNLSANHQLCMVYLLLNFWWATDNGHSILQGYSLWASNLPLSNVQIIQIGHHTPILNNGSTLYQ